MLRKTNIKLNSYHIITIENDSDILNGLHVIVEIYDKSTELSIHQRFAANPRSFRSRHTHIRAREAPASRVAFSVIYLSEISSLQSETDLPWCAKCCRDRIVTIDCDS